jgi:hypothetical protein
VATPTPTAARAVASALSRSHPCHYHLFERIYCALALELNYWRSAQSPFVMHQFNFYSTPWLTDNIRGK